MSADAMSAASQTLLGRRILITGGNGFVGGYLRSVLAEAGAAVVATGIADEVGADLRMDVLDPASVALAVERTVPDVVVHLAGQASVGTAMSGGAARTWQVNVAGSLNLALALGQFAPGAAVLFASSSEVYGRAFSTGPVHESMALEPANVYAKSKMVAEMVLAAALAPSAPLIVARPFNHTGPGQREDFVLPSFAGQVARIEAGLQPPTLAVGNLDVERDFLDVRDVARAYLQLITAIPRLPPRFTCNITTGSTRPLRALVEIFRNRSKVPFAIEVDPERVRKVDIPVASGSAARLHAATGWTPKIPIERTIEDLLDAAREKTF